MFLFRRASVDKAAKEEKELASSFARQLTDAGLILPAAIATAAKMDITGCGVSLTYIKKLHQIASEYEDCSTETINKRVLQTIAKKRRWRWRLIGLAGNFLTTRRLPCMQVV